MTTHRQQNVSGFLFIGDPHISSKKPGRRKDEDFASTVLNKVEYAIEIANEHDYLPVFLGDMFNKAKEDSEAVKTRLIRILRKAKHKPVSLVGNHDISNKKLSDDDSLSILEASGIIDLIKDSGKYGEFELGNMKVGLGGTPYGDQIPNDVTGMFKDCKGVIWITHHDLAFEGSYPGSTELKEIKGVGLAINGHMHLTKKLVQKGKTTWFNPGNITRQSVDAMNHIPRVWGFSSEGQIEPFDIPYEKDVFDLTGYLVDSVLEDEVSNEKDIESVFVKLIELESSGDINRTFDGSVIMEQIEEKFKKEVTDGRVRNIIVELLKTVVEEKA